jgi:hypothetical protein
MFNEIVSSINYITNASFFYPTMGMTAAASIFLGAAFYNGEIKQMWKAVIVVTTYASLLLLAITSRVSEALGDPNVPHNTHLAYASSITIFFLTIYYILGLIIGVYTVQRARRK